MASFGWVVRKANSLELKDHEIAPSVAITAIPPIDLQIHEKKKTEMNIPTELVVQQYLMQ